MTAAKRSAPGSQALIPLAWLTGKPDVTGPFRNRLATSLQIWRLVFLITTLNISLLVRVFGI
jgi:Mn2+/Fe2+ NRAMP family transporter